MRDKLTKITNKIGKLLDLQTGLFNKGVFARPNCPRSGWLPRTAGPYPPTVLATEYSPFLNPLPLLALSRFMSFRQECALLLRLGFESTPEETPADKTAHPHREAQQVTQKIEPTQVSISKCANEQDSVRPCRCAEMPVRVPTKVHTVLGACPSIKSRDSLALV